MVFEACILIAINILMDCEEINGIWNGLVYFLCELVITRDKTISYFLEMYRILQVE